MTDHARWADATAAYLLGALDDEERQGYEAHAGSCPECREEIAFLRVATDALPASVAQHDAPPALKDRIMSVVHSEAELLRAAGPEADRVAVPRRRDRRWWQFVPRSGLALAAACVVLVVGIGIGIGLTGDDPRNVTGDAPPGVKATLQLEDDGGRLVLNGMDAPPEGKVMQVWLVHGENGKPEPTDALFRPNRDGSASVAVPGDMDGVTRVMVSEEPEGGSQSPTTAPSVDFKVA